MIPIFAFCNKLDNGDRDCGDDNHMNITALTQNKLQENPEHHQYSKNNPHLITCPSIQDLNSATLNRLGVRPGRAIGKAHWGDRSA